MTKGEGSRIKDTDTHLIRNSFNGHLNSDFSQTWESEARLIDVDARVSGQYSGFHTGSDVQEKRAKRIQGQIGLSGLTNLYLGQSAFAVLAAGSIYQTYDENKQENRNEDIWTDLNRITRQGRCSASAGLGWGRLRNVVPLLRAQRLSERLVALGGSALTSSQIQALADVLATEYGYRHVFSRSNRHFWGDVLVHISPQTDALTPYEILYLTDVLNENLGDRQQGFQLRAQFKLSETHRTVSDDTQISTERAPVLELHWSNNLSLTHQLSIVGGISYMWYARPDFNREASDFGVSINHLWNVADRYRLDSLLVYNHNHVIEDELRKHNAQIGTALNVFLEDQVSVHASIEGAYGDYEASEDRTRTAWSWTYGIGLTYHLDRQIF